jgi:hypothetical protein
MGVQRIDQRVVRRGEQPMQFSVRSLFVITALTSLWLGAWAVVNFHDLGEELIIAMFAVIFTCPFAIFGYIVGRWKLGIVFGIAFSALLLVMLAVAATNTHFLIPMY